MQKELTEIIGKTMRSVQNNGGSIIFTSTEGERWIMQHNQDCCENVELIDICGDLESLVGTPILKATEDTNEELPPPAELGYEDDLMMWTFYNFATIKGYVTIRWHGTSNGYYSVGVDFEKSAYKA